MFAKVFKVEKICVEFNASTDYLIQFFHSFNRNPGRRNKPESITL